MQKISRLSQPSTDAKLFEAPMRPTIERLKQEFVLSGNLRKDIVAFLTLHDCGKTAAHCIHVADEAKRLARHFNVDVPGGALSAEIAGLLHDISAMIPKDQRLAVAHEWGIDVLAEEAGFPMIIHQKLSSTIAREIFDVKNPRILSAIGCHTTLKKDASDLDKVVFVADKIAWDQVGNPPYLTDLLKAKTQSLDAAAFCYLNYLWAQRDNLRVWHPWAVQAHQQLKNRLETSTQ